MLEVEVGDSPKDTIVAIGGCVARVHTADTGPLGTVCVLRRNGKGTHVKEDT